MRALAVTVVLLTALPRLASAQVYQGLNDPALTAERHRLANERARMQAGQRAADAQRQQLQTQLTLQRLEADRLRMAEPAQGSPRPLASPEAERRAREAATTRRQAQAAATSQIDAWLDRGPQ